MNHVPLSEIATINPRPPRSVLEKPATPVSFLAMSSISEEGRVASEEERAVGDVAKGYTYFERGDVLLAKITPCMENGKAAYLETLSHPVGFGSTEFHVLRPRRDVDGKYLFYCIWNPRFRFIAERNMTGSAGQKRVPSDFLARYIVPLPPLREQKRIAAILDKADAIRPKRQRAIALTEDLLRSTFMEMFGDPVANPHGFRVESLGDLCGDDVKYGTSVKCTPQPTSRSRPVLRIPNVVGGRVNWEDLKYAELPPAEESNLSLVKGDLLFVRTNGNPEHIGRCAVFRGEREALFASYLIRARIRPDSECDPDYVQSSLSMPSYRSLLIGHARTTAGNYNISGSVLKSLQVPLPPATLQEEYLRATRRIAHLRDHFLEHLWEADALLGSLSQRAFQGEL